MIFFSLITTAFSSILYGIMVTAVIMIVMYFVLRAINTCIVQTLVFYITGIVMAVLLVIQFSMMFGAMQAKDAIDSAETYMSQLLEGSEGITDAQHAQEVIESVKDHFPLVGKFIDKENLSEGSTTNLVANMHTTITDYLNSYIWHRVWWILGFVVVACGVVVIYAPGNVSNFYGQDGFSSSSTNDIRF